MSSLVSQCASLGGLAAAAAFNSALCVSTTCAWGAKGIEQMIKKGRGHMPPSEMRENIAQNELPIYCASLLSPLASMYAVEKCVNLQNTRFSKIAQILTKYTILTGCLANVPILKSIDDLFFDEHSSFESIVKRATKAAIGISSLATNIFIRKGLETPDRDLYEEE